MATRTITKTLYIYKLTDARGETDVQVLNASNDAMPAIGGYDVTGVYRQYDSYEGYYLAEWADKYEGLSVSLETREIEVEVPDITPLVASLT